MAVSMYVRRGVLRALMDAQGLNGATLAREAGVSASLVRQVIRGDRPTVSVTTAALLATALGCDTAVLAQDIDHMWAMGPDGPTPLRLSLRRVQS